MAELSRIMKEVNTFTVTRNTRNVESTKGTVDMCSVPVTTSEPLERADSIVAVGTKVRHIL